MSASRYTASGIYSEGQLEIYPKFWRGDGTQPGIIFAHGAGGDAMEFRKLGSPVNNAYAFLDAAVEAGYAVISLDYAGNQWGNASAQARMDQAYGYLTATMGAKPKVGLMGQSMGHLTIMNWAAANRSKVSYAVSSMGVADLANIYGQSAYTAQINAAYGGSYSDASQGALYNPSVNTASKYSGMPWLGFAGTSDTTCPVTVTRTLKNNIGSTATLVEVSGGVHNWDTVGLWNIETMKTFIKTYG